MRNGRVRCFTFLNIFVLFFVLSAYGGYGLGSGDSLIVADFFGMPGDTVVDSVIAVNSVLLLGFSFRLVYDSTLLTVISIDRAPRTDYFLSWAPTLGKGWLYHYCFASGPGPGQDRPPLSPGRGSVAYITYVVASTADSGQACVIEFQSDPGPPPRYTTFVDTLYNQILPPLLGLKDGQFIVGHSGVGNSLNCFNPVSFSLSQNYPNPFNATTAISYQQSAISNQLSADGGRPSAVTLRVYNIAGQLVRTLIDEKQGAGDHSVLWDGRNGKGEMVGSGVYLYRLRVGSEILSRKMVLLR